MDRAVELKQALTKLMAVARESLAAHAVLYFEVDRGRDAAYLRAWAGPSAVVPDCGLPLGSDPFAFVLERGQSFYATDFKRLLWSLPYYRGEVKIGTLLAIPVKAGDVVTGVLVADRLEMQSLTGREPDRLQEFAGLVCDVIQRERASLSSEEIGAEFKAVYEVSRRLAAMTRARPAAASCCCARPRTSSRSRPRPWSWWTRRARATWWRRPTGWARGVRGPRGGPLGADVGGVGAAQRAGAVLLDDAGRRTRTACRSSCSTRGRRGRRPCWPCPCAPATATWARSCSRDAAAPSTRRPRACWASSPTRPRPASPSSSSRSATSELAARDGLTGLYNRRAFDDHLARPVAREERQGGRFALLLLDIDHFKKLNDTFGHPAGDAALKHTARVLERHLRQGDEAGALRRRGVRGHPPGRRRGRGRAAGRARARRLEGSQVVFEGARLAVTVSVGVAVWPEDGREIEALLAAADRALYAAKQDGRNRVASAAGLARAAGTA